LSSHCSRYHDAGSKNGSETWRAAAGGTGVSARRAAADRTTRGGRGFRPSHRFRELAPPADDMGANGFRFKILGRVLRLVFHLSWTLRLLKGELAEKHLATLRGVESSEDGS
jgi:hypothetical protein